MFTLVLYTKILSQISYRNFITGKNTMSFSRKFVLNITEFQYKIHAMKISIPYTQLATSTVMPIYVYNRFLFGEAHLPVYSQLAGRPPNRRSWIFFCKNKKSSWKYLDLRIPYYRVERAERWTTVNLVYKQKKIPGVFHGIVDWNWSGEVRDIYRL